jgi:hypothetical protein
MSLDICLPEEGWLKLCSVGCKRPTAKELVVFVIKKYFYDSYICACCEECFKKKIIVEQNNLYEVLSKVRYKSHTNTILVKLY